MQLTISITTFKFGLKPITIFALPIAVLFTLMFHPSIVTAQPAAEQQSTEQAKIELDPKPNDEQWRVISPSDAKATFQMPKKPRYIERTFAPVANKPPIKVHLYLATVKEGKATYIFGYHDLHEAPADRRTMNKALEGAVRGSVLNVQGKLLEDVTKIEFRDPYGKKVPGRQFSYSYLQGEKSYVVLSRVFIVGKRQFQITALSDDSVFADLPAADYLNSFKLVTIENDEPPVPRIRK